MRPQIDNILLIEPDGARQALWLMALLDAFPAANVEPVATSAEVQRAVESVRVEAGGTPFDCVLLRDDLPGTASGDTARRLRAMGVCCPVIVLSDAEEVADSPAGGPRRETGCLSRHHVLDGRVLESRIVRAVTNAPKIASKVDRINQRATRASARAYIDPLTGLADRGALRRYLSAAGEDWVDRAPWAFMTVDASDLGTINHRHGFAAGDKMLRVIAGHLQRLSEAGDFVSRHRSGEFLIIKPVEGLGAAMRWAETFQDQLSGTPISISSGCLPVRASIGAVLAFGPSTSVRAIHRSRQAAHCAKRCSGSRIATWSMVQFERTAPPSAEAIPERFERSLQGFLSTWQGRIGPTKSIHLTTHAEFVSSMAVRLGKALGLQSEDIRRLRLAGLCHDLGKFLVPEQVLCKSERLTEEERGLLCRHAPDGADMARLLGADARTTELVRYHHARFDGAGGADRIENVPLGAHILCVADAFVTMTSHRPYKRTRTFADALRELQSESGRQFAPAVVDALPVALLAEPREASIPGSC